MTANILRQWGPKQDAAEEMYEALKAVLEFDGTHDEYQNFLALAKAALAKAEGKQP